MGKDPAFLFYPNDYMGGTMGFSFEMHGAYLIMLLYQFNNGPFSDDMAVSMIGKIWELIQHKFKKKSGSGLRYNEKLENVIELRENFLTSRRNSAMKRWNKTDKPLSDTKIDSMLTQCLRNAHAMRAGNGNGNGNENENGVEKPTSWYDDFEEYLKVSEPEWDKIQGDWNFIREMKNFHPKTNIRMSIEKAWSDYWGTEAGWNNKREAYRKAQRTAKREDKPISYSMNWKLTIQKNLKISRVPIPFNEPDHEEQHLKMMERRNETPPQ
jgi:hypothetical protein